MSAEGTNEELGEEVIHDEEDEEEAHQDKMVKEAKDKLMDLGGPKVGSSLNLMSDLNAELDIKQRELLKRVRKSVHLARGNAPNLRLASSEDSDGMKMVDMSLLLGIIEEEETKLEVQKEVAKSKKMVENISKLLSSEGFL